MQSQRSPVGATSYPLLVTTTVLALVIATCSSFTTTFGIDHHRRHRYQKHHRRHDNNDRTRDDPHMGWGTVTPEGRSEFPTATELRLSAATDVGVDRTNDPHPATSPLRRNKFQVGVYDRPIVLIGCRGSGNELYRLAKSIPSSNSGITIVPPSIGVEGLRSLLGQSGVDKTHVLVLDFDEEGVVESPTGLQDTTELARVAYEDEGLLSVYVNVDPEESEMSKAGQQTRTDLESTVFRPYSDYELCIKHEGLPYSEDITGWSTTEWQLHRLLARATLPPSTPGSPTPSTNTAHLTVGRHTFFLSLSFPDAADVAPYAEAMCRDVDAMELRVDLLNDRDDEFEVLYQTQAVRALCRAHAVRAPALPGLGGEVISDAIPVVYTVRTAHQAGTYPDDPAGIEGMFRLLETGLRGGVEVLDVESAWDPVETDGLLSKVEERYASQVLGSHHVVDGPVSTETAVGLFRSCALDGRADAAKVVLTIVDGEDDHRAEDAGRIAHRLDAAAGKPHVPHVGLILGEIGQYSRAINALFTPVTHESLPSVAAPGQLSAKELMEIRTRDGLLPTKRFGILGSGISYSVSPAMQGGAFEVCGLPHTFELVDYETVEEIIEGGFWKDRFFGGCCVTIPHKQAIIPFMDRLTEAAEAIGAVNTVLVEKKDGEEGEMDGEDTGTSVENRVLVGDNTDWKGIFNPLHRRLATDNSDDDNVDNKKRVALILGGGGTARAAAYAATRLGLEKVYYNRTPSKAEELARSFGGTVAYSLENSPDRGDENPDLGAVLRAIGGDVRVVISTLPAAAEFELPSWIVRSARHGGDGDDEGTIVVFDVNYKPYHTKLLRQAEGEGFPVVRGSEMLWEQGVGQFELWTGRTAPYGVMKDVVLKNCLPKEEEEEEEEEEEK